LLALLGAHPILHVSRIRVKIGFYGEKEMGLAQDRVKWQAVLLTVTLYIPQDRYLQ
jgi:hypothetical protein